MAERSPLHDVTAAAGAVFTEEAGWMMPGHYGDTAAEYQHACSGAAIFDVSHRGLIEIGGPDARRFLHNLCTNDIMNMTGAGCEAFLATAKAKAVAYIQVCLGPVPGDGQCTELLWLDAGPGMGARVFKHLDHYLISEQVELADRTADLAHLYLIGPESDTVWQEFSQMGVDMPPLTVRRTAIGSHVRYDITCPSKDAAAVWEFYLEAGARPAGLDALETLRVEAGLTLFGKDIDEDRFVVEVDRTKQAICYTKGCYLGQEPIVMARDRGHVNRLLRGLKIAGSSAVPSGTKVFRDADEVGQVTSSVVSPRFGAIALAYIRRGSWEPGTAVTVAADGEKRSAEVVSLPFDSGAAP